MTPQYSIVWPMIVMALWTLVMLPIALLSRIKALKNNSIKIDDFRALDVTNAPSRIQVTTKHIANLFEVPVLFYAACLAALATQTTAPLLPLLATLYVALRMIHSVIHLTYNQVRHRVIAFVASNITLVVLWIQLAIQLK